MRANCLTSVMAWMLLLSWAATPAVPSPPPVTVFPVVPSAEQLLAMTNTPPPVQPVARPLTFYASADYLLWRLKPWAIPVPLLVTPSTPTTFDSRVADLTDVPVTTLYGNQNAENPQMHGFRVRLGGNAVIFGEPGFEVGGFFLPEHEQKTTFRSQKGAPDLLLPFRNSETKPATASGLLIGGTVDGEAEPASVTFTTASWLWGAEVGPTLLLYDDSACSLRLLVAFRNLGLNERLTLSARNTGDDSYRFSDQFSATNYFFGGQVGGRFAWDWQTLQVEATAKIGVGATATTVRTSGSTFPPNSEVKKPKSVRGGFYSFAQQGIRRETYLGVVPEVGINLGWRCTDWLTLRAGYDFLWWNAVASPGAYVNPTFKAGDLPVLGGDPDDRPNPTGMKSTTDFWAHGLQAGFEIEF
ncbi:MAG: BBP7 family outer membrane beta-barrel protein [Gemmataceae bacterium]